MLSIGLILWHCHDCKSVIFLPLVTTATDIHVQLYLLKSSVIMNVFCVDFIGVVKVWKSRFKFVHYVILILASLVVFFLVPNVLF